MLGLAVAGIAASRRRR
ncbi:MAG: hypothetical protein IPK44_22225 [Candidatus Accumulibacter sp.]|nr:hypothetical protein [Accumulibacter sp.]MBK8387320.1 hypothetical protein [Accumulibacter sp.]MBK8576768.1 hypothetical protein [Candidatus Accumulibacter propinquus]MBN8438642.1 hypothetical protein [Accumulibacter sp.]